MISGMSETHETGLISSIKLELRGSELAQLHQAVFENSENRSRALSHLLADLILDGHRFETLAWGERVDRTRSEIKEFYRRNSSERFLIEFPSDLISAITRSLSKAKRLRAQNGRSVDWEIVSPDPDVCAELYKMVRAAEITQPRLATRLLSDRAQSVRAELADGGASELEEVLGI